MCPKNEKTEISIHAKVPVELRKKFEQTGLKLSVWIPKAMEDEIHLQNQLRMFKRDLVHQMGSQEVNVSSGQSHPDHRKTHLGEKNENEDNIENNDT